PEAMTQLLRRAQPAVEYFVHEVWVRADRSAEGRSKSLQEAAQVFKNITDPTQRDFAIGTFASALGVDEATLRRGLRRAFVAQRNASEGSGSQPQAEQIRPIAPQKPPPKLQLDIICIIAEYPELLPVAEEGDVFTYLTDMRLRDMYTAAKAG